MDVSFRQGANHIGLAVTGKKYGLSANERIKHLALGILKLIPLIGHIATLFDTLLQKKTITLLKLTSTDPFERGEEHGRLLKKRIKEMYDPVLGMKRNEPYLKTKMIQFEKQIPENIKEEMKGLAKGSGYSYEDVLLIHTFLDAHPGEFGCTSMVVKESNEICRRIAAANHPLELSAYDIESQSRRQAFLDQKISNNGTHVLKSAGVDSTIQAMVLDTTKGEVYLSSKATHAARGKFKKFEPSMLFHSHEFENTKSNHQIRLFRNLDWPWYFLGQDTVILTRPQSDGNSTVSISWPGYIGTLSGINNRGVALTANLCGEGINLSGIPNPLLFTHILDTCQNVDKASQEIYKSMHGSSMNIVIADKTSAKSFELQGGGSLKCVGDIQ